MFEADTDSCQYRNVMSICYVGGGHVYFIERSHQLEIYYSWDEESPEKCSVIRSEIMKALVETEEKLCYKPDILTKGDVFICSCNGPHPRHFCAYNRWIQKAMCEKSKSHITSANNNSVGFCHHHKVSVLLWARNSVAHM